MIDGRLAGLLLTRGCGRRHTAGGGGREVHRGGSMLAMLLGGRRRIAGVRRGRSRHCAGDFREVGELEGDYSERLW